MLIAFVITQLKTSCVITKNDSLLLLKLLTLYV